MFATFIPQQQQQQQHFFINSKLLWQSMTAFEVLFKLKRFFFLKCGNVITSPTIIMYDDDHGNLYMLCFRNRSLFWDCQKTKPKDSFTGCIIGDTQTIIKIIYIRMWNVFLFLSFYSFFLFASSKGVAKNQNYQI